ncbi:MAG: hypothetical protein HY908_18640 [Myxococcales bacterium]|nr:hypothetical protein [Myxococcales bacterium]
MPTTLAAKLQIREGSLFLLNAPDGYAGVLARDLVNVPVVAEATQPVGGVLLFVHDRAEAERLAPRVFDAAGPDGVAWIAYPKGGSGTDLDRDRLWRALASTGWRPVRQVALDATWSAMRFRPAEKVASAGQAKGTGPKRSAKAATAKRAPTAKKPTAQKPAAKRASAKKAPAKKTKAKTKTKQKARAKTR